jgi:hypothetical protein
MSEEAENTIAAAIDAAEDICNPLDGLTDRIAVDPGAPFAAETLRHLAALKAEDRAVFKALRAQIKRAGVRVTALHEAIADETRELSGRSGRGPTQADLLVKLSAPAELFHAADGTAFADINVKGHRETWPIRSKGFRRWLARLFFDATQGAPNSEALQSALNVIEAIQILHLVRQHGRALKSGQWHSSEISDRIFVAASFSLRSTAGSPKASTRSI